MNRLKVLRRGLLQQTPLQVLERMNLYCGYREVANQQRAYSLSLQIRWHLTAKKRESDQINVCPASAMGRIRVRAFRGIPLQQENSEV